jgi:uncharacterized protein (DUF1684 family)
MLGKSSCTLIYVLLVSLLLIAACKENSSDNPEMKKYIDELIKERKEKNYSLQFDINSPFNREQQLHLNHELYNPNPDFIFKSKLIVYDIKDTVAIIGTKGETRPAVLLGYLELKTDEQVHKINVYQGFSRTGEIYYSIWFTDQTTGNETYGVGRYLDFELNNDPEFVYTIDFNKAYNPYCAYSSQLHVVPRVGYIDIH